MGASKKRCKKAGNGGLVSARPKGDRNEQHADDARPQQELNDKNTGHDGESDTAAVEVKEAQPPLKKKKRIPKRNMRFGSFGVAARVIERKLDEQVRFRELITRVMSALPSGECLAIDMEAELAKLLVTPLPAAHRGIVMSDLPRRPRDSDKRKEAVDRWETPPLEEYDIGMDVPTSQREEREAANEHLTEDETHANMMQISNAYRRFVTTPSDGAVPSPMLRTSALDKAVRGCPVLLQLNFVIFFDELQKLVLHGEVRDWPDAALFFAARGVHDEAAIQQFEDMRGLPLSRFTDSATARARQQRKKHRADVVSVLRQAQVAEASSLQAYQDASEVRCAVSHLLATSPRVVTDRVGGDH